MNYTITKDFLPTLQARMKESGISQRDLSAMAGVTPATVNKFLNPLTVGTVRLSTALSILESLGIDISFTGLYGLSRPMYVSTRKEGEG